MFVGCGGGEGYGFEVVLVSFEGDFYFACLRVPEAGDAVVSCTEEEAAVEGGGDGADPFCVSSQGPDAVACCYVPDAEGLVARGGDEEVAGEGGAGGAGGDEADGGDGVVVAWEGADVLVGV